MSPIPLENWRAAAQSFEFNGRRIAYWTAGKGPPLLLVHGFPTASWDWTWIWGRLASTRRVIACDMLGFGYSDKPRGGYSIHLQADLQAALLKRLDAARCDALVHDYGVSVGQELLARQGEDGAPKIGRMCFLNGGLFPEQHRARLIQKLGVSPLGPLVSRLTTRRSFGRSFKQIFGASTRPSEAELDALWSLIEAGGGDRLFHKLLHYIADRRAYRDRWVGALTTSGVPLKLINGGADPVSGVHLYHYFKEMVPDAEAVLLPEIGHYPQIEAPDRVYEEAVAFLNV